MKLRIWQLILLCALWFWFGYNIGKYGWTALGGNNG